MNFFTEMKMGDFGTEMGKLLPLIIREFSRTQKDVFAKGLLTVPQIVILEYLDEKGTCKMNELAKVLDFTMSAATAIIDKMLKAKLVKRERCIKDRRVVNVSLLNKGKEFAKRVQEGRRDLTNELFSVLSEEEKSQYLQLLKKVSDNLMQRQ